MDELETAIRSAVDAVAAREPSRNAWTNPEWTNNIRADLVPLGIALDCFVNCIDAGQANGGEWLWDMAWTQYRGGILRSLPLALETEWNCRDLDCDFQKLVVARAQHRVFLFNVCDEHNREYVVNRLLHHAREFDLRTEHDRYLLGAWHSSDYRFRWYLALGPDFQPIEQ